MVCNRFGYRVGSNRGIRINREWCVLPEQIDLEGLVAQDDGCFVLYNRNPSANISAMKVCLGVVKKVFRVPVGFERANRVGAYRGILSDS